MLAEIIPHAFFDARGDLILWLLVVGSIGLLVFGADRVVSSAAKLAATLGLSQVIIGATVVSLGTTSPEAAVSVNAAFQGDGGLALGNAIGSIICDTALIFGLGCVLTRLPKDRFVLDRHGWLQFAAGLLLTLVLLALWALAGDINQVVIPRKVGFGFVAILIWYLYISVKWSRQHPVLIPEEAAKVKIDSAHKRREALIDLVLLFLGLSLVVFGSELLIGSVKVIAVRHRVPPEVLAVTLVAFGTSVPELATAIASIVKGHSELLVGNIIGADILNVLFVVGLSSAAVPLKVDPFFYVFLVPVMMVSLTMFRIFIFWKGSTFRRWQGIPLLLLYLFFVIVTVRLRVMNG
jgi:cation:H+ antiporter